MDKIKRFEERIEKEENHFKKIKMIVALNKIKEEIRKNEE